MILLMEFVLCASVVHRGVRARAKRREEVESGGERSSLSLLVVALVGLFVAVHVVCHLIPCSFSRRTSLTLNLIFADAEFVQTRLGAPHAAAAIDVLDREEVALREELAAVKEKVRAAWQEVDRCVCVSVRWKRSSCIMDVVRPIYVYWCICAALL